MSKSEIERMASAVGTSNSQHKQPVPWAQMNTSKEHFSPINGEILPQNDDEIIHAIKNNIKRLDRLKTRNSEILGDTSLDVSDRARRLPSHSDTSQTMPTTSSVGSTASEILPQNADNFAQNSSANLVFKSAGDMLTWRATNVGENLKPNRTNDATPHASEGNSHANKINSLANEANLSSANLHPQNAQILANNNSQNPQKGANLNIYNLPKKSKKSEEILDAGASNKQNNFIQEGFNYLANNHENITAFASGAGKIYHDYAGGINKAIAKGFENLAGDYANANFPRIANALKTSSDFFAQNANLAAQSSQILKEQMARGNNYAGVAGEILFDPMLAMPAGIITKGGKGALNTLKSIGAGASLGAGTSAIRDYNNDAISEEQMRQNAIINSAIWGGANGLLASKLIEQGARNLGHKIAPNKIDDYATAMAKKGGNLGANEANLGSANSKANLDASGANLEANPHANFNPSAQNPNLGAKNPRASQRELEGSIDFSQLEKSDFTPNFTQVSEAKQTFPYNAFLDIENSLAQELKLPNSQIKASLEYLRAHHPESFKSKREVYETIKSLLKNNDYVGDSLKNKNAAYIAKQNDELISDMAINRDSGGVFHLNKDRKMSNSEIERMASAVGTSNSQHKQLVPWAQMNTSKEHFSPTNGEILPQNADNFAQNLDQSAQNLSNANLNAPNLPNANFHNPRAEFSANNAYENFSNPNNPRAFMNGGGDENPRFIPYSASQNPRANARGQEERTGFLNGEHLGAKEASLMNGSVDFTHLKKADFPPSSSANLAFENSQDALTWRAQSANVGENLKPNGTNTARTNQSTDEANLRARQEAHAKAQQEAINEQEHLNANSLTNDTRANEANLRAQQEANLGSANEANLSSADTTKVKLTKEQNEAQKLLKQILKALKTSPTKKPFSISAGEKQTWEGAINEKLKELKEKEQILKEQPSANFGEVPHTLAQPSLNLNALEKMKFSLSQEATLKAKIKAQKAKLQERANKNLEALIKKEQTAHTKTSQEVQQQALQDAGEAEEKLGALLDYAKSNENKARNFINSLLLRSTLGAGYGALANKDDRLKGAMIGAGAGAIGIPLLRALPRNFGTTMAKNALSGGVIGATSDSDNRVRGAIVGALAGAGGVPLALKAVEKTNLRDINLDEITSSNLDANKENLRRAKSANFVTNSANLSANEANFRGTDETNLKQTQIQTLRQKKKLTKVQI